jgi:L-glyceraldehyde 3-phosphate reductase
MLKPEALDEPTMAKVHALTQVAQGGGRTLAQLAIAWILRLDVMTSVLIGASSVQQLEQNLGGLEHTDLSADEQAEIERILG